MNKTPLLTLGLFAMFLTRPVSGEGRDLLAHSAPVATDAPGVWICRLDVRDPKLERSVLIDRDRSQEGLWNELHQIPSRIALLSNDGADLVALLAPSRGEAFAHEWAWGSPTRFAYGPAFPAGGRIAALAGGGKGLWALGASGDESPATRPTTLPATMPSVVATTRPAGRGLTLYQFKGTWKAQPGVWPADLSVLGMGDVSMAVIDETVHVAARTQNDTLRLMKYDRGRWLTLTELQSNVSWTVLKDIEKPELANKQVSETKAPRYFKLLSLQGKPALWIQPGDADVDAAGILWTADAWCNIEMPQGKLRAVAMDLVIVRDQPRLYYINYASEDRLMEQALNLEGKSVGKPQQVVYARKQSTGELNWITITVMAVLTIVILNMVLRRRSDDGDEKRDTDE